MAIDVYHKNGECEKCGSIEFKCTGGQNVGNKFKANLKCVNCNHECTRLLGNFK